MTIYYGEGFYEKENDGIRNFWWMRNKAVFKVEDVKPGDNIRLNVGCDLQGENCLLKIHGQKILEIEITNGWQEILINIDEIGVISDEYILSCDYVHPVGEDSRVLSLMIGDIEHISSENSPVILYRNGFYQVEDDCVRNFRWMTNKAELYINKSFSADDWIIFEICNPSNMPIDFTIQGTTSITVELLPRWQQLGFKVKELTDNMRHINFKCEYNLPCDNEQRSLSIMIGEINIGNVADYANYKLENFKRVNTKINNIKNILERENFTNNLLIVYLGKMLQSLKQTNFTTALEFSTSLKFARWLLEDDNYPYNHYELLYSAFGEDDRFIFQQAILPICNNVLDQQGFSQHFKDILLPYLFENENIAVNEFLDSFYIEGPYEINNQVCLKQGDVVIDAGANMGLFSAVASAKGCKKIYAFEPMEYTRNNYLNKTAAWNKNIVICPYALSDKEQTLIFSLENYNNTGAAALPLHGDIDCKQYQQVQAITLDEFASKNNLNTIDFIKVDIEGDERKMLAGAKNVIREFSPKISICTYHLQDDPRVLREMLLDIQPKYKILEKFKKIYAYIP